MYFESKSRSIVKSISWRILATLTTLTLVYIFIGDTRIALSVGGIEIFLKMFIYFLHERGWDKLKFGRKEINPAVIWISGLAKSGKKEIALELQKLLQKKGYKTEFLDGHSVRDLFPQTGFEREDVNMHIERIGYLAKKLEHQGVFVIASFLSPYKESREFVRRLCSNYHEIHISTSVEICEQRDDTGIFKKARSNEIKNFPGIHFEYETSDNIDLTLDISQTDCKTAAKMIFDKISETI